MKIKHTVLLAISLLLLVCGGCQTEKKSADNAPLRPNILIIFTDDQGYADLACYGNTKHKTPRLDQLAQEGTRFTNAYAEHICGPSRSALLTGRYPFRSKGWGMPATEITFAEMLKTAGYQTACIGKWDVSNRKPILERMPNAQGFDYYFGTLGANDGGRVKFYENNELVDSTRDMGSLQHLYTEKAINFLTNKRDPEKPFVLYLAHTMMHVIIDASPEFRGTSAGGLYGDVVEEFDYETGRLLDKVDELGLRENTLVIYTSDNGPWNQPGFIARKKGHPEGSIFWGEAGPLRAGKGSAYEAGSRVPCIVRWPGKIPEGRVSDEIFATIDLFPTFGNLAGYEMPTDRVIDGVDQSGFLLGRADQGARESYLYNHAASSNIVAIRSGKWKLLLPGREPEGGWGYLEDYGTNGLELYDLDTDIGERNNLAAQYPEITEELKGLMQEIISREP